jgi:hypothetical protein
MFVSCFCHLRPQCLFLVFATSDLRAAGIKSFVKSWEGIKERYKFFSGQQQLGLVKLKCTTLCLISSLSLRLLICFIAPISDGRTIEWVTKATRSFVVLTPITYLLEVLLSFSSLITHHTLITSQPKAKSKGLHTIQAATQSTVGDTSWTHQTFTLSLLTERSPRNRGWIMHLGIYYHPLYSLVYLVMIMYSNIGHSVLILQ